jgi:TonB family protein
MRRRPGRLIIGHWYEAHGRRDGSPLIVALSLAAHALLVAAFVDASGPLPAAYADPEFRPVFYLPPPNRPVSDVGGEGRVRYVAIGGSGQGSGLAGIPEPAGDPARPIGPQTGSPGDQTAVPERAAVEDEEPVYTVVEVHEEAVRAANSAAPAYPPQLLSDGVEGAATVQYVVDASGVPDTSSLRVISTTRREFADAVREALPHMRFTPARIDNQPVRQLVEQPFSFRIVRPAADTLSATATSDRR